MDLIPFEVVKQLRDIADVLHSTSVEILETKKNALREGDKALAAQISQGKDVISILCMTPFTLHYTLLTRLIISSEGEYGSCRGR